MAVNNTLVKKGDENKFSVKIQSDAYKNLINNTLGDPKRAQRFIASVSSAVATNKDLQACDAGSILAAALLGEALNLSPSPQLGHYYMVPYDDKKKGCKVAQFQLGYKGYLQLAIRSGQYRRINVLDIKEGELKHFDPLNEVIEAIIIDDWIAREQAKTIGYYAMFELTNGFRKAIYWSKERMLSHADKYSQAFSLGPVNGKKPEYDKVSFDDYEAGLVPQDKLWLYSSFWYKDFDGMAFKTMLRQLISKWGIMSTEMQNGYVNDMAVLHEDGQREYVDNVDLVDEPAGQPEPENTPVNNMQEPPLSEDPSLSDEPPEQDPAADSAEDAFFAGAEE